MAAGAPGNRRAIRVTAVYGDCNYSNKFEWIECAPPGIHL
jgi:hypothetical protein